MSEEEFVDAYAQLTPSGRPRYRLTDMTGAEVNWMIENTIGPNVLEVGCGRGFLAERLATEREVNIVATDVSALDIEAVAQRVKARGLPIELQVANVEDLPFADRSFDTVLCAHTLEHVRKFERAVAELVRVTRRRLLVNVPCQRYYRYTVDYHLHFFPEPEHLLLRMGLPGASCEKIDGDLCYRKDFDN
jgi:ubiquinone/menaquinone biosynthesis C-methylase UbiE